MTWLIWTTLFAVDVYFSPNGGAENAIVSALVGAKKEIWVQAYSFTSVPIAKALLAAQQRGVRVEVLLDKSNRTERYSAATFLSHAGVPTYIDAAHAIAHNKIVIIDGETVVTGSYNFTKAAEQHNAENLLIFHDPPLAGRYLKNWQKHREHSKAFVDLR